MPIFDPQLSNIRQLLKNFKQKHLNQNLSKRNLYLQQIQAKFMRLKEQIKDQDQISIKYCRKIEQQSSKLQEKFKEKFNTYEKNRLQRQIHFLNNFQNKLNKVVQIQQLNQNHQQDQIKQQQPQQYQFKSKQITYQKQFHVLTSQLKKKLSLLSINHKQKLVTLKKSQQNKLNQLKIEIQKLKYHSKINYKPSLHNNLVLKQHEINPLINQIQMKYQNMIQKIKVMKTNRQFRQQQYIQSIQHLTSIINKKRFL